VGEFMRIGKVTIYVKNPDDAITFWVNKLGFELKVDTFIGSNMRWIEVGDKYQFTNLIILDKKYMESQNPNVSTCTPSIIFSTKNIKRKHRNMRENNVLLDELLDLPFGLMFTFYDQDNQAYIMREDK
jgi:lactoylglutathione lyase